MSRTFVHEELLPHETSLVLDEQALTISLWQAGERVVSLAFTEQEYSLLSLFLGRGDVIHCTYDEALSIFTKEPMEACLTALQTAREQDEFEETHRYNLLRVMQPVIVTLEQCTLRLHQLGLHPCALANYGYVLVRYGHEAL